MEKQLKPGDYVLPPGGGAWVRVGDAVIYIRNDGDKTDVKVFEVGREMESPSESIVIYSTGEA